MLISEGGFKMTNHGIKNGRWLAMLLALTLGTGILGVALSSPASAATRVQVDGSWTRYGKSRIDLSIGNARTADSYGRYDSDGYDTYGRYQRTPEFYGWEPDRRFTA